MTLAFEEHNFLPSGMRMSIMNKDRSSTDKIFLLLLFICVVIWIPTVVYAQLACDRDCYTFFDKIVDRGSLDLPRSLVIVGFVLLSGLFTRLIFLGMLLVPKCTRLAILALWLLPVGIVFFMVYSMVISTFYLLLFSICSIILVHYLLCTEWFHLSDAVLGEACKAIVYFPSVSMITALCYTLAMCVAYITFATYVNLESMDGFVLILHVINYCVGMWVILFILAFGQMVLCGAFATWYWNEKRDLVPKYAVFRCSKIVLRYHLGTVAKSTSLFGVFDMLYQLALRIAYRKENKSAVKCLIVYHLFDSVVCRFVASGAIVKCISEGKDFTESASTAIDYFEEQPKKCLITTKILETMLLLALTLVQLLTQLSASLYTMYAEPMSADASDAFLLFVTVGSFLFIYSLLATLHAAFNTVLMSCLEDWKNNDGGDYKPYAMSDQLRLALGRSGSPRWYRALSCSSSGR